MIAGLAALSTPRFDVPDDVHGAGQRLAGIWEPGTTPSQRKTAIRGAFAGTGKSYAGQAYASVARLFDQYVERWTGMYTDACEATHVRGEQSAEVLDLRMACLSERLGNARALSDVFASADGKVVENAVGAAAALPSLDRCADVAALRAVVKPPEDPATRRRVDDLRTELAKLIALRDSGQCARAIPKADALIADVRAAGYQPLLAETLFASAHVGDDCGDLAGTLQRFKEAHAAASASHNDEVAAQASALIPSFAINRFGQELVAREWLVVARGDVARLGRETLADAMLAQAEGMLALTEGAFERALTEADRSIAVTRRLLGPDDLLTIQWEANKADWLQTAGRLDEALRTDVAAREHFERLLGSEHPRVALISSNEGEVLNLLGRHAEAEIACRRAVQLFRQSGARPDVLGWALTGLVSHCSARHNPTRPSLRSRRRWPSASRSTRPDRNSGRHASRWRARSGRSPPKGHVLSRWASAAHRLRGRREGNHRRRRLVGPREGRQLQAVIESVTQRGGELHGQDDHQGECRVEITDRSPALLAALVVTTLGCSEGAQERDRADATIKQQALTTSNGLAQNGLTTNGLVENGMWTNGMWTNGMWTNGSGPTNGMLTDGMWTNGMWTNGMWTKGMWTNGMWTNGLQVKTLQAGGDARQLLQYIYSCAMPAYDLRHHARSQRRPRRCFARRTADCDIGYTCYRSTNAHPLPRVAAPMGAAWPSTATGPPGGADGTRD